MRWPNETLDQINTKKYEWNTLLLLYFLLGSDKIWVTGTTLLCTVLEIKGLVITLQKSYSYLIKISYDFVYKMKCTFTLSLSAVKPVNNDHTWDLINVVVMQRVNWKRSAVSKVQVGYYGFKLTVVDWWLLFRGGRSNGFDCYNVSEIKYLNWNRFDACSVSHLGSTSTRQAAVTEVTPTTPGWNLRPYMHFSGKEGRGEGGPWGFGKILLRGYLGLSEKSRGPFFAFLCDNFSDLQLKKRTLLIMDNYLGIGK